jgi:hypothetical protein
MSTNYSFDDPDRDEWDRAWRSMSHRVLDPAAPPAIIESLGTLVSLAVSLDPSEFAHRQHRVSESCAICGGVIALKDRQPASLHATWTLPGSNKQLSLSHGVWVHLDCFEQHPIAEEPAPVPW